MSKGNMFLSQARGKVGSVVFSVSKGQQIARVYNPSPANPRSFNQQAQRSLLANMTKFYRRAINNFFKFSFEDKSTRESDYNAFARNNINNGVYLTREMFDNDFAPALGAYIMTKGSLAPGFDMRINGDDFILLLRGTWSGANATIGEVSTKIMATYPTVQPGDIVTFVGVESELSADMQISDVAPYWRLIQFRIDTTDTRTTTSLGLKQQLFTEGGDCGLGFEGNFIGYASMGTVVLSRNTPTGLRVSDANVQLSAAGGMLVSQLRGTYAKKVAAISWGGNPEAYLQGAELGDTTDQITEYAIGTDTGTPFTYGSFEFSTSGTFEMTVSGVGLKTTARGGKWEIELYNSDPVGTTPYDPVLRVDLTATATTDGIAISHNSSIFKGNQEYFVLKYQGDPYAWGLILASE